MLLSSPEHHEQPHWTSFGNDASRAKITQHSALPTREARTGFSSV
jgi:hypothetical protein